MLSVEILNQGTMQIEVHVGQWALIDSSVGKAVSSNRQVFGSKFDFVQAGNTEQMFRVDLERCKSDCIVGIWAASLVFDLALIVLYK